MKAHFFTAIRRTSAGILPPHGSSGCISRPRNPATPKDKKQNGIFKKISGTLLFFSGT